MFFDPFVLPFTLGMIALLIFLFAKYSYWIWKLPSGDRLKIVKGVFTFKTFRSIKEIVMEGLLHRKIFRVNSRLGYMHMSLAFGWFLLIVFGTIEAHTFTRGSAPIYLPIFFRYFVPENHHLFFTGGFTQLMDLLLLFVLSGLGFAIIKRFRSITVGLKKTTRLKLVDKMVLTALWLIFPLRLLAESFTSGTYHSGGFLTGTLGQAFAAILPVQQLAYPAWWAYSISLCLFFVGLPFTRYMHIPTEMVLIFLRNYGIRFRVDNPVLMEIEVNSCPKCGICIDKCQLNSMADIHDTQAVYFIQKLRNGLDNKKLAENCLMCGRCEEYCPVGIDLNSIRLAHRNDYTPEVIKNYEYIPAFHQRTDVIYFAGCMTHLTPAIEHSMVRILEESGDRFWFMDKDKGSCCGRPLVLAGQLKAAAELVAKNRKQIAESGAQTLVTSCPICYKTFKEDYQLELEVLHHSEYIDRLIQQKRLKINASELKVVYHDPCELGRGSGIYAQPRNVVQTVAHLQGISHEKENGLCCGGSLANLTLSSEKKRQIATQTMTILTESQPDVVATSCPLCKKTLGRGSTTKVMDIAELVARALPEKLHKSAAAVKVEETVAVS